MYEYKVRELIKVVDGDTIDVIIDLGFDILHKARVRLYGIDTPESRTRDLTEKKFGLLSKSYLTKKLTNKDLVLRTHKEDAKGKFGRILGEIMVRKDDRPYQNINEKMVKECFAVRYHGQDKDSIEQAHLRNRQKLILKGYAGVDDTVVDPQTMHKLMEREKTEVTTD